MGALLQAIFQGAGRTGNELQEAKTANQKEREQQAQNALKLQQFKAQMAELNQRLQTGKAPQFVDAFDSASGERTYTERDPLTGDLKQSVGGKTKPPAQKAKYVDPKQDSNGKWWGLNVETQKMEMIPGQDEFKAVTKPQNRDDKYIAIQAKKSSGAPLSKDEQDYATAYDFWVKKTKIDPGVERAAAFGPNRFVNIIDPNDPEAVTFMRAGDAARMGARSPQSIFFQIDKAVTKYFVAGTGAGTINYFNTAIDHLKLLSETADALKNSDVPKFNQLANFFARETGSPAPSNFDSVRAAVAGEISKTFKGVGATDQEIALIESTINNAQSPEQIQGAINYYLRLMDGKMRALQGQYEAGKKSQPNFPKSGGEVIVVSPEDLK